MVNNIFNQRPTNKFNIYVRFDSETTSWELKSGMSARISGLHEVVFILSHDRAATHVV